MKKLLILLALFATVSAQAAFTDWFLDKTLRIDYYHSGDRSHEYYSIDQLRKEPYWGGSKTWLIDTTSYGAYYIKAYDKQSGTMIYSHGYCTLFDEWKFTDEAKITQRTYSESVVMPYPLHETVVDFYSRNDQGIFEKKFSYTVDPKSPYINTTLEQQYPVYESMVNGDAAVKVDIVIIPEGYTAAEMDRFKADCDQFTKELFTFMPYSLNRDKFNIRGVLAPSEESGTDIPEENVWKRTLLNSNFYTFASERYLMTPDHRSVRNLAANAPYDQIYILVNSTKYGGGAIYNFYNVSVNSNASSAKIFVHEFGHGFAGLADEYDDGSTSFNDMYPLGIEPWEPNITTLTDFGSKWKDMLPAGTPVPTPLQGASPLKPGVYEGAGYVAKGIYRPVPDCLMRSFKGNEFCPVCSKAIQDMINRYTR